MIRAYTLSQLELQPQDITSVDEVMELSKKAGWVWIDCIDPKEEDFQVLSKLLKKDDISKIVGSKKVLSTYEKINGFVMIQFVQVDFKEKLEVYPLYCFSNGQIMITVRTEQTSNPIINSLDTLQDCIKKVTCKTSSSFVISRLFHEIVNENLNIIVALRERICEMEQEALEGSANKKIDKSVFALKREITKFERILWVQRETMLAIIEGMIPTIQTSEIDKNAMTHTISNISRELSLISAHSSALDNVLTVRGLGMIHKVETNLVYLTVALTALTLLLILFELGLTRLIFG
jgi:Mg2+ and Co2+ transporter CorA